MPTEQFGLHIPEIGVPVVTIERMNNAVAVPDPMVLDVTNRCVQFEHMKRKTVSLDPDVYRLIKSRQLDHESISATLRRELEAEKDPADYLDELFREYGGRGIFTEEGRARIRHRQEHPASSSRPRHARSASRAP
jgi:predicted CopG family antitoxin